MFRIVRKIQGGFRPIYKEVGQIDEIQQRGHKIGKQRSANELSNMKLDLPKFENLPEFTLML